MKSRDQMKQQAIERAKNLDQRIDYRAGGHCFVFDQGIMRCVGCDLAANADWKGKYLYRETAQKIAKEHGDCGKPFDLKKRIAEIEAQYAPKTGDSDKEVTLATINDDLATINAKLDKIIKRLGIW